MSDNTNSSAEARWGTLSAPHSTYLETARYLAALTDPSIIRYWDGGDETGIPESYNSIGARGANHLSNKINQVMWPATLPFIKNEISEGTLIDFLMKLGVDNPEAAEQLYTLVQRSLAKRELMVKQEFETSGVRPLVEEATLHAIVTGTSCLHIPTKGNEAPVFFNLSQLRLVRDYAGTPIEFILCQKMHKSSLPRAVRKWLKENEEEGAEDSQDEVKIYTWGKLDDECKWHIHQEVKKQSIPGTESTIPKNRPMPYVFLTGPMRHGEHYGHSHIEVSGGQSLLRHLEFFTKGYMKRTAMAARTKIRVAPGAITRPREYMRDDKGDFIVGNRDDYEFVDLGGMEGFQLTKATMDDLKKDLGQIFLLYDAVRRDGERVTAYENQLAMSELQAGLGTFATSIQMGQQRIAALLTERIKSSLKKVAPLPEGLKDIDVVVVTGMNAMSRQVELNKESAFVDIVSRLLGPEAVQQWLKVGDIVRRIETASGLPGESRVKSVQEVQREAQEAQMAQVGAEAMKQQGAAQQGAAPQPQPQG